MHYSKPEIVDAGAAVGVIQGTSTPKKPHASAFDSGDSSYDKTVPAYEADE